ncbi:hypothetical protein FE257_010062 [Aspergillus nanangensis]|uniref:FAD-binding domain-containing protein n=1 Tax=Aspergillus nanangensis TaxID=2582783 RepID=A0AAD4GYD9_ASPNN|nr:hypothetical protein FE257_010062 [Aspergillus nanangensis]
MQEKMQEKMEEPPKFKVIIVGGSIAGLTLAHCLAQANIDHVVLERRSAISPQEGAFIGIWPNGARVFEQLGIFGDLENQTAPFHRMHLRYPDGFSFTSSLPELVSECFGYPIITLDRQRVLQVLHERYPCQSNIHVNQKVVQVQPFDHGARVLTEDGSVYTGDLIVGADGVHSSIRAEMWRLADATSPGLITDHERKSLTVEYSCVFGISSPIPGLESGELVNAYADGCCVITFHGADGRVFWFMIEKLPKKYVYPDNPRFSMGDAEGFCARLAHVPIWRDICVEHLWKNRLFVSMTALEEGLFQTWHFGRVVLLGDSVHKMTPNIGQGANTAVEDAATLASLINKLVLSSSSSSSSSTSDIQNLLQHFQSLRYDRVKRTYEQSCTGARLQTRDDLMKILIGRYIFPYIGPFVSQSMCKDIAGGHVIDFLPLPKRSKAGWVKYNRSSQKSIAAQLFWLCPVIVCLLGMGFLRPWMSGVGVIG